VDLSSIEVTADLQEFRFTMESVDLTLDQATSIQGTLDYEADPAQLCVELTVNQVCPLYNPGSDIFTSKDFAVVVSAEVVYGGTTVSGSTNDSLGVQDGNAEICEFVALPPEIDLNLDLEVGAEVSNADVLIQGGNLRPNSEYVLTMHSTPVELYRGLTDETGSFSNTIQIPSDCPAAGRHKLVLTGTDLDGNPVTRVTYFAVDSDCKLLTKGAEQIRKIRSTSIFFEADKAVMTKEGMRTLKALYWAIRGADSIKVEAYTNPTRDTMKSKWTAMKLARKRAQVIVKWLKARGVEATVQIQKAIGPKDFDNNGPAKNRRAIVVARWLPEVR
jgi:outer membrane protein OmpA-like peptidoglycan-associated protein